MIFHHEYNNACVAINILDYINETIILLPFDSAEVYSQFSLFEVSHLIVHSTYA